jgi:membrane protein implicated in regulation of membrane protease activity
MDVPVIVWACIVATALLVEFFTFDFSAVCLAVAGIVTVILAFFNVSLEWQIPIFIVLSIVLIIFVRPICKKFIKNQTTPTNMDANIGKVLRLTADVIDEHSTAELNGVVWTVICEKALKKGDKVEIVGTEGNKLVVKENNIVANAPNMHSSLNKGGI